MASSPSLTARLTPESASRSVSSGSCYSSATRPDAAGPVALLIPLGEAALQRLLPAARRARQGGVPVELGYGIRKLPRELERGQPSGRGVGGDRGGQ